MFYKCTGGNNYLITLKMYRDCFSIGGAPFDDFAAIGIFDVNGNLVFTVNPPFTGSNKLPVTLNSLCFNPPTDVCVEEAIYTVNVNLPPLDGGYIIAYQRCCRNTTIVNINDVDNTGSTYSAQIPDKSIACNSSPYFNKFPPIFLCANDPLTFDHSATDPDGDSLAYELCDPFMGGSSRDPFIKPNPPSTPPYGFVTFNPPYSGSYPISSSPAIHIDPRTGLLTLRPNLIGQYVVAVCVKEFRKGKLLSTNKRDFQFNVVNCPNMVISSVPDQQIFCFGYKVDFLNSSINSVFYHWDFGDTKTSNDTSNIATPTYTYSDSGTYKVTLICNPGTDCADTGSTTFFIYPLLNPDFDLPPGQCITGNSFNFAAGGTFDGKTTKFIWDFGAGTPGASNLKNPNNIVFSAPGTYPITLTMIENGCTKAHTASIVVFRIPEASFNAAQVTGCVPLKVIFTDASLVTTGTIINYLWDFGDGNFSSLANPIHAYTQAGKYNVSFTLETTNGCLATLNFVQPNLVTVYPLPTAAFIADPTEASIFDPEITITDKSLNKITCFYSLPPGPDTSLCSFKYIYSDTGTYIIKQIVTSEFGCTDSISRSIHVNPEFRFWIPNTFTPNEDEANDIFYPVRVGLKTFQMDIFDRWGEMVFTTKDKNQGWDGKLKGGKPALEGIYIYQIKFLNDLHNTYSMVGRVTLLR